GWEVDEHKQGSKHGESVLEIRRCVVAVALVFIATTSKTDETNSETEIRSKREDLNRTSNISDSHSVHSTFVEGVEEDFKCRHREKLRNCDASENSAEGDETRSSCEIGLDERSDVENSWSDSCRTRRREETAAKNGEEGCKRSDD